jgi:hypothetical protein
MVDRGLILARVDLEEQVAFLHPGPGVEGDPGDVSRHPRPHVHRLDGLGDGR